MTVIPYTTTFSSPLKPPIKHSSHFPTASAQLATPSTTTLGTVRSKQRLNRTVMAAGGPLMWHEDELVSDICATGVTAAAALGFFRLWQETAKRGVFDQKVNRKLVHISVGLIFLLCWPLFSSGFRGAAFASLVPGINILRLLIIGRGMYKDEATVQSISRFGDYRELLQGPLYYTCMVTFACAYYWRYSPIGIGAICNLCAGDGLADIVGRRFGKHKLPYNKNKSFAGSITMAVAGFLTSVAYVYYFSLFGFIPVSWNLVSGFFCMSVASAIVESLPISTELDDNLTVPVSSFLIGSLFF